MSRPRVDTADLRARVLAEVLRTPSPTRAASRRRVFAVGMAGVLATVLLFFATGGVSRGSRPAPLIAFTVGLGLVAAAVLTRLSSGTKGSMLGWPREVLLGAVVATPALLALVAFVATVLWPGPASEPVPGGAFAACGALTLLQGLVPLLVLLFSKRGSDPVHPAISGAALGMMAGSWAAVMAYLRCSHAAGTHTLGAHVLPTVVLAALGAALGGRLLRLK